MTIATERPADRAYALVNGFRTAQVVRAAVELRIPDLLAGSPMSAAQLSTATSIPIDRMRRLLRGLAATGVLIEQERGLYANSEVGEMLREGVPGSRHALARMLIPESYESWGHFMHTLRTGTTGHSVAHGMTLWEHIASDPDFGARFNAAMASLSEGLSDFVSRSHVFNGAARVVDVGGGKGALLAGVLHAHPGLRGTVLDLAAGLVETAAYLDSRGVLDRCEIVEGDFFQSVPAADVYLLKDILHDWDDEHAAQILAVIRRAMSPSAHVLILERVVPSHITDDPAHLHAVMTDLQMMVQLGGRERTLEEYEPLFQAAGLRLERFTPGDQYHLVEAVVA